MSKKRARQSVKEELVNDIDINVFDCKYMPLKVKFRNEETEKITRFLDRPSELSFLMVTGLPGCGKTLLVNRVLQRTNAQIATVNAMTCKNYIEFIYEVAKQLGLKLKGRTATEIKSDFKRVLNRVGVEDTIVIMIDEFDNLFRNTDKEPFDLFILQNVKIIGISNDIEFLQVQSQKFKFPLPDIENITLKPYTQSQLAELVSDRIVGVHQIEDNALKLITMKAFNEKGGDMRNVLDICKRVLRNNTEILSKAHCNSIIGIESMHNQKRSVFESFTLQQQLIILAIYLSYSTEIDLPNILRRITEIQFRLGINLEIPLVEQLEMLQDYNILHLKEIKSSKNGLKSVSKRIVPRVEKEDIKDYLAQLEVFQGILI